MISVAPGEISFSIQKEAVKTPSPADAPSLPAASAPVAVESAPAPAPTKASPAVVTPLQPTRYQHYQSMGSLNISVMAKNLTTDLLTVEILPHHLKVVVSRPDSSQREVVIDKDLYAEVDCEKSSFSIFKTKVEIALIKLVQEIWPSLEHTGAPRLPAPRPPVAEAVLAAGEHEAAAERVKRPKAYSSQRDWDQVESSISKELEAEKPEGDEALNALFRQIYKDADPETKMAMKKSFQTSGGTVLSTNWKEVKEKNYEEERQAPKGMEWRNWDGQKLKQVED